MVFLETVSCRPVWLPTYYIAKDDLEFRTLLSPQPKCCDQRPLPSRWSDWEILDTECQVMSPKVTKITGVECLLGGSSPPPPIVLSVITLLPLGRIVGTSRSSACWRYRD